MLQDHIHLYLSSTSISDPASHDDSMYPLAGPTAGLTDTPAHYAVHQRSLTGSSHIHRLVNGSGNVKLYKDVQLILGMVDEDQYERVRDTLVGQRCWYIPVDHPDYVDGSEHNDPDQSGKYEVFMLPLKGVKPVDPSIQYRVLPTVIEEVT